VREEDAELVRASLAGRASAFGQLYERYKSMVYELAYRMTRNRQEAEDVLQDTFLKAMRSLHTYDPQYKFSTWVLTIASRLCVDRWRLARSKNLSLDQAGESGPVQVPHPGESPDKLVSRREVAALVENGLTALPEKYRAVLVLRHRLELSYEEISQVLGMPLGTVKTRIHRARERLARILQEARGDLVDVAGGHS
jgi:RNA polymerase sigma-70 factor (ECF subfamily)